MTAENADYIPELVPSNPGPTDFVAYGEDHISLLKQILQNQFSEVPAGPINNAGEAPSVPDDALAGAANILFWSPKAIADFVQEHFADWSLSPQTGGLAFSVNKDGNGQSLSDGSSTKVTWSTAAFDDGPRVDLTNNRHIPGAAALGRWRYTAALGFTNSNSGSSGAVNRVELRHYAGNGSLIQHYRSWSSVRGADELTPIITKTIDIGAADEYVEVYGLVVRSNELIQGRVDDTWFEGHYIGAAPV